MACNTKANAIIKDFERFRGDDFSVTIQKTIGGVAQDLNGYSYIFTAKRQTSDTSIVFTKTFTISTSQTSWDFVLLDTEFNTVGTFFYDIQETDNAGLITTVFYGQFTNFQDITA